MRSTGNPSTPRWSAAAAAVSPAAVLLIAALGCGRGEPPRVTGSPSPPPPPSTTPTSPEAAPRSAFTPTVTPLPDLPPVLGSRHWLLPPGRAAEVHFEMTEGQVVFGNFSASADLVVDTHQHIGDETVVFGTGTGKAGQLRFAAPSDGLFSFGWAHPGAPDHNVEVLVELRGQARLIAWIVQADVD